MGFGQRQEVSGPGSRQSHPPISYIAPPIVGRAAHYFVIPLANGRRGAKVVTKGPSAPRAVGGSAKIATTDEKIRQRNSLAAPAAHGYALKVGNVVEIVSVHHSVSQTESLMHVYRFQIARERTENLSPGSPCSTLATGGVVFSVFFCAVTRSKEYQR